jgi:hypothetical protein
VDCTLKGKARALKVGESRTIEVEAGRYWNRSEMLLGKGCRYDFSCNPKQQWIDWSTPANADGYESNSFILRASERLRRFPDANWIALIGAIGASQRYGFKIGISLKGFTATQTGELCCFANDVSIMYWNNSGSISLTVKRVS